MKQISPQRLFVENLHPRGLRSLWDMLTLDARKFISFAHMLLRLEQRSRNLTHPIEPEARAFVEGGAREMVQHLTDLDLPVSRKTVEEMVLGAKTYTDINAAIRQLWNTFGLELDGRKFYGPLRRYEQYYEQVALFGDDVFANFSSANTDIFEAGTCLALERGTACVMHLMRVLEAGLKCLAAALNVTAQNDWGSYIREIERELAARIRASGARTSDEQFYAEASVTFDAVRRAWRNPTMHIANEYSPERAEEILIAVRALMRHLATRLSE
jgi:hypothetical protein